ncbi:hypothetical protein F2P56_030810 [Juglans regia]|uniref:RNase H type-1 domain-containing protein n=1 Tax=Juglans regia TaxID=51240 RepID=A0A833WXT2_JUGRE|nr:hypothetical protein F2P56_030810 [Juglans regia]
MGKQKGKGGLGYRDLESFNLALLAKQGWRILQNENSIAAKILKEKYYKNKSLLDASLGHRPSFLWRSVWNALSLLKEGFVKANWDAAVEKKQRRVGLGVLIRDEDGKPLAAVEGQKDNIDHPAVAEAQALWKAMVIYM